MVDHARRDRWIGSNTRFGLGDHLVRPVDLPCPTHPALVELTVMATERMHIALNLLDPKKPLEAKNRLTRFWFDVSVHMRKSAANTLINRHLDQLDYAERYAAVLWMTGGWHPSRRCMERLAWSIQCSPFVVTGACHLHDIAFDDDESRSEQRKKPIVVE